MKTVEIKPAMSHDEMEDYWKTLCSFKGEDIQAEINILNSKIKHPQYLYKYRAVNNNNLDALRSNKLFFSKANSYDDPFDTFLHIDKEKIYKHISDKLNSIETLIPLINEIKQTFQNQPAIPQDYFKQVTSSDGLKQLFNNNIIPFLEYILTLRPKIQNEILSICFSENGFNESLWLKYADMHRGFCLMYDLYDAEKFHCGKMDKCLECGMSKCATPIYPVYYSEQPYDATNFAFYLMAQEMKIKLETSLQELMEQKIQPIPWEIARTSLIKKECHKYDEEWRMIANCKMNLPATIEWVPAAVIIGLRTSTVDTNLIISMAKEAGIKKIYKSCIDEKSRLNAYPLQNIK